MSAFKKDFLWGAASAAYQVEGAFDKDGKSQSVWDVYVRQPGVTFKGTNGDVAVDHYNRYKEDVALMKEMGLKAYRFSIAWTRILPSGRGKVNEAGVKFYENLIDELLKNGIEPLITLYHWDLPQCLQDEYGGWESRKIIDDFDNYARALFKRFKGKVKYWVSLNEQNIFTGHGWQVGIHPPKVKDDKRFYAVNHIAFLANAKAIKSFHEIIGDKGRIGPSFAYTPCYPYSCDPDDVLAYEIHEDLMSYLWMDVYARGEYPKAAFKWLTEQGIAPDIQPGDTELLKEGKPDFMGVNYYRSTSVEKNFSGAGTEFSFNTTGVKGTQKETGIPGLYITHANPNLKTTDWDWAIDPKGLRISLRRITSRYNLPILISENGLGAYDTLEGGDVVNDDYRIEFLRQHIEQCEIAVNEGVDLLGFCVWSFTDLLSWLNGYQKRYGFVYVNREELDEKDLRRIKKKSFEWYKKVIADNGVS